MIKFKSLTWLLIIVIQQIYGNKLYEWQYDMFTQVQIYKDQMIRHGKLLHKDNRDKCETNVGCASMYHVLGGSKNVNV